MSEKEENELICEKLLGLKPYTPRGENGWYWESAERSDNWSRYYRLTFDTWEETGLILDAFKPLGGVVVMFIPHQGCWSCSPPGGANVEVTDGATGPLAIRAAALAYIRSLK